MRLKTRKLFFCYFLLELGFFLTAFINEIAFRSNLFQITSIFMSSALIVGYIQYFSIEKNLAKSMALNVQLAVLKQQQALQEQPKDAVQTHLQELNALQQSTMDQMEQFLSYLNQGNPQQASLYLENFTDDYHRSNKPICDNYLISAILNNKRHIARSRAIDVSYQIQLPQKHSIAMTDLSCIFFNLMDNGIEACTRCDEKRFLSLTVLPQAGFLSIHMQNSKSPQEVFNHETAKSDTLKHGFGLFIIEELVKSYDGSCEWIDNGNTFTSLLLLQCSQSYEKNPEE